MTTHLHQHHHSHIDLGAVAKLPKTHMPFLVSDNFGNSVLLFCSWKTTWKACALMPDGSIIQLSTRNADDICECSPTAWYDDGWHVTLIAGGGKAKNEFKLYSYFGHTLDELFRKKAICSAVSGHVYKSRIVRGFQEDLIYVYNGTDHIVLELLGAQIYRVSYRSDKPDNLLISGGWGGKGKLFTVDYNLSSDEQRIVICDGKPAYKCTIHGDIVMYADMIGSEFEDRKITLARTIEYKPVSYITKHV